MIEAHNLSMSCVLTATLVTTGCVVSSQAHNPAPMADTQKAGTPVTVSNKADLVGCWTDMHWIEWPSVEPGYASEKKQVGVTMCFDADTYFYLTNWPTDAMGTVGPYKVVSAGALELRIRDRTWHSLQMKMSFPSKNEISGEVILGGDASPEPFLLRRDPANKTYLKLKELYEDWTRAERAASH